MKDIIRNPDELETKCVDGKGVEILTTAKEYTNVFNPTRNVLISTSGKKLCNVSKDTHRRYYTALQNTKRRQHKEFKDIQEGKLKMAQEKLSQLEEKIIENQEKQFHKSNCICKSDNNKQKETI